MTNDLVQPEQLLKVLLRAEQTGTRPRIRNRVHQKGQRRPLGSQQPPFGGDLLAGSEESAFSREAEIRRNTAVSSLSKSAFVKVTDRSRLRRRVICVSPSGMMTTASVPCYLCGCTGHGWPASPARRVRALPSPHTKQEPRWAAFCVAVSRRACSRGGSPDPPAARKRRIAGPAAPLSGADGHLVPNQP